MLVLVWVVLELIVAKLLGLTVQQRDVIGSWRGLGEKGGKIRRFGNVVVVSCHGRGFEGPSLVNIRGPD